MMAMEAGTFVNINPRLEIPCFDELLSTGGSCCKGTIESLAYLPPEEAAKESPQTTHGAFPPVLDPPGLKWRMLAMGPLALAKTAFQLLTTDIDDIEMYQYDFIRLRAPPITPREKESP